MQRSGDYRDLLKNRLSERMSRNPRYSLRAYAKSLGLNPGTLSRILSGKHLPSPKVVEKIQSALSLTPEEREKFLSTLIRMKKSKKLQALMPFSTELAEDEEASLHPASHELSIELFRVIGDWYHVAMVEQTLIKGYDSNPRTIAKKLGIPAYEAKLAIERLLSLGILKKSGSKITKTKASFTTADKHLTSSALKRRQKQILEKSIHALENFPIETRNHSAMTMAIDPALLPEAKKRIEAFNESLSRFLEKGERKIVYELQTSLFPLEEINKKEK